MTSNQTRWRRGAGLSLQCISHNALASGSLNNTTVSYRSSADETRRNLNTDRRWTARQRDRKKCHQQRATRRHKRGFRNELRWKSDHQLPSHTRWTCQRLANHASAGIMLLVTTRFMRMRNRLVRLRLSCIGLARMVTRTVRANGYGFGNGGNDVRMRFTVTDGHMQPRRGMTENDHAAEQASE